MVSGIIDHDTLELAVEGYAGRQSYLAGEEVTVHCSSRAATFAAEVTRVGATREPVWRAERIAGVEQPVPADADANGCGWSGTFTIPTDATWRSGFYEIALTADGVPGIEARSHAFFVIRPRQGAPGRFLLVLSTNTYQAYNQWGGRCLYTGATHVSFQRPMDRGFLYRPDEPYEGRVASIVSDGDVENERVVEYVRDRRYPLWCTSSGWHNWERRFVRWAERAGYAVDVAVNADLQFHPEVLDGFSTMVSVGHDEYWTWAMRDTIDAFVERGGNHAIFSGNTSFWQVRLEDEGRRMVAFKMGARDHDPVIGTDEAHLRTSFWSDPAIGRPETSTIGLTFTRGGYARMGRGTPRSSGGYEIHRPDHWAFEGTDLCYGDQLGADAYVVGYEVDGCALTLEHGLPVPTHEDGAPDDLVVLASAPARLLSNTPTYSEIPKQLWADTAGPGDLEDLATRLFGSDAPEHTRRIAHNRCVMASFTRGQGEVFNAGSADWASGLGCDPLIDRVTANVLDRFLT